jgi:DHA1 family bicyclomycin/chloramphenicol resistance-like MFS transporter
MQPIGHIAGIGAATTGFLSTMMAVPISTFIGKYVIATALPLFIGFLICSTMALLILVYLKVSGNQQIIKKISFKSV